MKFEIIKTYDLNIYDSSGNMIESIKCHDRKEAEEFKRIIKLEGAKNESIKH